MINWRGKGAVLDIYVHGDDPELPTHRHVVVEAVALDYHGNPLWIELQPQFTGQPAVVVPWTAIRFISVKTPAPEEPF